MDIKALWQESLQYRKEADEYLSSRKLQSEDIGYLPYLKQGKYSLSSCVVIPVFSVNGVLDMLELRSIRDKQYLKLYRDNEGSIPIWNIHKTFKQKKVVITEGIFNAMSFNALGLDIQAIATLRASISNAHLYYLAYLYDEILVAYDNDDAGNKNTERLTRFYSKEYPDISVSRLDFLYNDLNEFLIRKGANTMVRYLEGQI